MSDLIDRLDKWIVAERADLKAERCPICRAYRKAALWSLRAQRRSALKSLRATP